MYRFNPKYFRAGRVVLIILVLLVVIAGTIAYFKREQLLQDAIGKATAKAKREYNLDVKIGSASFVGLSTVSLSQITVVPEERDSLLKIDHFELSIKLWPLILGRIKLASVALNNGELNLVKHNGAKNYDFFLKHKRDTTATDSAGDVSEVANNLINQVLYKIPDELDLKNFSIKYHDDSTQVKLTATYARIQNSDLTSEIVVNGGESTLHFSGKMRPSDKYIDVKLYADNKKVEMPFLQKRFGLRLSFDTVTTQLKKVERSDGQTRIYGSWSVKNLLINHPRIASNDIIVPDASIDANIFIGAHDISIDSSSVVHLKDITLNPYVKYTIKPAKIYELKVHMPSTVAQNVFNSFPQGTFDALDGIQVNGELAYDLDFYLDTTQPDNLRFNSNLQQKNFHVTKYGRTNLDKLNHEFTYTPYEGDKPMPSRFIGASNPNYTPLDNISIFLQRAVMTAEDPSFYYHHGFVVSSIRKSIIIDFKEKRFKRGGSTISMQLVKNAFLSRQKTMVRKVEETLIVWMIENTHIIPKNRMLEVYFNIIEWGRNIYGIGEASRYYFGKTPSELNLGESIYLASIVPKPKAGLYSFQPDGSLKPYLNSYYQLIGGMMAEQHFVPLDSADAYGFYQVRLKQGLRQRMSRADTAAMAKMLKQSDDEDDNDAAPVVTPPPVPEKKPNLFQRIFGKKDTTTIHKTEKGDTVKTKKELRQERRAERQKEKDAKKKLADKGLF